MNKIFTALMLSFSVSAFAAVPSIDFSTFSTPLSFNSTPHNTVTVGGITLNAFTYSAGTYTGSQLWLRHETPTEVGLGVCSEGTRCGSPGGTGSGDYNELSNEGSKFEVIRLTLPTDMLWTNLFVSSLDTGGSHSNESGILYWSDSANPVLSSLSSILFSHSTLGADYGSIWNSSIDSNAKYLFFTPNASNGTNNDYLVWGASVSPVPEPETYAMLLAGLGLISFILRRKQNFSA